MKMGLYKHYKGNLYQAIGLPRHSETLEELVAYQSLYGDYGLWVRPKSLFEGEVLVDGEYVPRFAFIGESTQALPALRNP